MYIKLMGWAVGFLEVGEMYGCVSLLELTMSDWTIVHLNSVSLQVMCTMFLFCSQQETATFSISSAALFAFSVLLRVGNRNPSCYHTQYSSSLFH